MSDTLRDQLQHDYQNGNSEHPETWDPRQEGEGAMLVGELVHVQRDVPHRYGTDDIVQIADEETGELRSLWLSFTVLRDQWNQAGPPEVGDRVGIIYLGTKSREGAHDYHNFSVRSEKGKEPKHAGDGAPQRQPHPSGDPRFGDDELPSELYD